MYDQQKWKHGTFFRTGEPDAVAVFDDEHAECDPNNDCDAIYLKYGERFSPCRTVDRTNPEHWRDVLLAWSGRAPLLDMRSDRRVPLPQ